MSHLCPLTEPSVMVVHDVQVYKVICDGMKQEGVSL